MSKVSAHITLAETTKSQEAIRKNISNVPTEEHLENMKYVAENIFEKIRSHFNTPIGISSFYRSPKLNEAIGGSSTSQHCFGMAIDIDGDIFGGITNKDIFEYVKNNLIFDQLIWEMGNNEQPDWVHVSLKKSGNNRKEMLKAVRINKKTIYTHL